ncbi:iron complex transport system substrate-binding protein [Paenibacillus cellulosilyticus]|uniref:Iron complex transport system substrate-binding protein n=1 Tax=Paenibacillus cellulosilyticus TaxID=375489 RepID=A0A2V2Z431_9BACL|nr:ABC transporter substrate-binding protein [Paenibacillus cellulosilyticus]PWW08570.1 iron complex transport system substrate-binding protein [Paenibacillus cellulosilyticus]QKS48141.1 ABC transporter substrate-binding protein [Paenibacillus cellulosilyticus]
MKKQGKLGIVLMSILILAMFLSACGSDSKSESTDESTKTETSTGAADEQPATDEATEKVVTDAMGHEVTIPANPQKVLASYLEDHLATLGVKPVAQWSVANGIQDYLQASGLEGVPTIGYDLPVEQVASFAPDLIIIGSESSVQNDLYDQYSKIAPTYVLGDAINNDWRAALTKIGELLNKSDEVTTALAAYDAKAADVKAKLAASAADQSAAVLWFVSNTFYIVDETKASGSILYNDLGVKIPNVVAELPADQKANWNKISLEKLADLDADHIFLVNSDAAASETVKNDAIWKNLKAVKAGNVYELPRSSSWLYSGDIAGQQIMDDVLKYMVK